MKEKYKTVSDSRFDRFRSRAFRKYILYHGSHFCIKSYWALKNLGCIKSIFFLEKPFKYKNCFEGRGKFIAVQVLVVCFRVLFCDVGNFLHEKSCIFSKCAKIPKKHICSNHYNFERCIQKRVLRPDLEYSDHGLLKNI